jgi:hypothetical protein
MENEWRLRPRRAHRGGRGAVDGGLPEGVQPVQRSWIGSQLGRQGRRVAERRRRDGRRGVPHPADPDDGLRALGPGRAVGGVPGRRREVDDIAGQLPGVFQGRSPLPDTAPHK